MTYKLKHLLKSVQHLLSQKGTYDIEPVFANINTIKISALAHYVKEMAIQLERIFCLFEKAKNI